MECRAKSDNNRNEELETKRGKAYTSWIPLLRQLFICSGVWSIYFVLGLCYGAPTVFIPQIRREANSTDDVISEDMASWLSSVHGYSAIPWIVLLPSLIRLVGRRMPFLVVCVGTILAFTVFYCCTSPLVLLISEIMQGILISSNMILLIVIITEYTSPQYRGIVMTINSTMYFWGVWIANATGFFTHWKSIALIAFVCSAYSLTVIVWPESPSWLAMKGKFKESAISHRWLRGFDDESEKELSSLIIDQRKYLERLVRQGPMTRSKIRYMKETLTTKAFYMPLLLSMMAMSLYNFTGKFVCAMYSMDLIAEITNDDSTASIGMLIIDAVSILSMQIGCILSKYHKRRTMLLGPSSIGIVFLFIISLYLYLVELQVIYENKIVSILLLALFSTIVSCGPMIIACSVYGELTPLRYKSISLPILAIYSELLKATVSKVSPLIFEMIGFHGGFLIFGSLASVFVILLYYYLPESKDKTLQEMEKYFT